MGVELSLKSLLGILLGVVGLVFIFYLSFVVFDAFFGGSWTCSDAENQFNLVQQYIGSYQVSDISGTRSIDGFFLPEECLVVGFNKGEETSASGVRPFGERVDAPSVDIKRPKQCGDKSCLCLCEFNGIMAEDDNCLGKNVCETYDNLNGFFDGDGDMVLYPSLKEDIVIGTNVKEGGVYSFSLYMNMKSNNVCMDKSLGACV